MQASRGDEADWGPGGLSRKAQRCFCHRLAPLRGPAPFFTCPPHLLGGGSNDGQVASSPHSRFAFIWGTSGPVAAVRVAGWQGGSFWARAHKSSLIGAWSGLGRQLRPCAGQAGRFEAQARACLPRARESRPGAIRAFRNDCECGGPRLGGPPPTVFPERAGGPPKHEAAPSKGPAGVSASGEIPRSRERNGPLGLKNSRVSHSLKRSMGAPQTKTLDQVCCNTYVHSRFSTQVPTSAVVPTG